jgi:uncharacterized membrane protein
VRVNSSSTRLPGNLASATRSLQWTGILLGIGLMASLDTVVFHLVLRWHNFYVHTTDYWRIVSDGLLHLATTILLFVGAARLWTDRRLLAMAGRGRAFVAYTLFGMGGFQLFDGIVLHLVLALHPVREGVANILPYDVAWNASAILILLIGWLIWRQFKAEESRHAREPARTDESPDRAA